MKTAIWILTLVGTVPVFLLALGLLAMHAAAAWIGPRNSHHDFVVSITRGDSASIISTNIWPLCFVIVGAVVLVLGVWKLVHN